MSTCTNWNGKEACCSTSQTEAFVAVSVGVFASACGEISSRCKAQFTAYMCSQFCQPVSNATSLEDSSLLPCKDFAEAISEACKNDKFPVSSDSHSSSEGQIECVSLAEMGGQLLPAAPVGQECLTAGAFTQAASFALVSMAALFAIVFAF